MKKRLVAFVTLLVLSLTLIVPAQADSLATGGMYDFAGLMSEEDQQALNQKAREISTQYGIGVYGYILEDYREYTDGQIEDAADVLFNTMPESEALLLILSMAERDYLLIGYGEQTQYTFNDEGRDYLIEYFLDDFGMDNWYTGFSDYFDWTADYIEAANAGEPYSGSNIPVGTGEKIVVIAGILGIALVIAGIYILILNMRMKSVFKKTEADHYLKGHLNLTRRSDVFTHKTTTRQKIEQPKSTTRSGGGGVRVSSGGGGRGTRGKF